MLIILAMLVRRYEFFEVGIGELDLDRDGRSAGRKGTVYGEVGVVSCE